MGNSSSGPSKYALANWRVRWRVVAMVAVPTVTAAFLGAFSIYGNASGWLADGRVQNLAQLNVSVVRLTQALEDERDLSAGYAANRSAVPDLAGRLRLAEAASVSAAQTVEAGAAGVTTDGGYQATVVQDLGTLLNSVTQLQRARPAMFSSPASASKAVQLYADQAIQAANTFSVSVGNGTSDADLNGNVTALGALLRVENQMSLQRALLFVALSSTPPALTPAELTSLLQAQQQQAAEQAEFTAAASQTELQSFSTTVTGAPVQLARTQEALALTNAFSGQPLTALNDVSNTKLTAASWDSAMTTTIGDTRQVTGKLVAVIAARAGQLRSQATTGLVLSSLLTAALLGLVILVSTLVARSLIRPLRKLRSDALDVADRRLPDIVRRLSQGDSTDAGLDIEPIGITSTEEIGEVARAFDRVHREAVRLAADEAMLRGNLNAMFINLSRRSQSLIERQLSLIDNLEQGEQDSDRLSSLFRLDHLATRMRRNSENLLVLAGQEVTRRSSQPVSLVDVLRAAISEIEQYERVVLNVQPGIAVTGPAVNDVVHLVAEIVENATVFSPEDTPVYVSGQPLSSGGVLLDITDSGTGISDQEMAHANWRLDNPPVVDVAVSRRMGLFVVGRLAARHGVRVRLQHAQLGGLTALIWLPDIVAAPEVAPALGPLRRFDVRAQGPAASLPAPSSTAPRVAPLPNAAPPGRVPLFTPRAPDVSAPTMNAGDPPHHDPAPVATAEQQRTLPIYDSLESDWFRRGGTTRTATQRAPGGSAGQDAWTSPADAGWRAAQVVVTPVVGEETQAGLPRRVPQANLVPGSVGNSAGEGDEAAEAPARSADEARSRLSGFQRGMRRGRPFEGPGDL
jgi:signal transduction histidine kinase